MTANALEMGESKLTLKAISSVIGNIEAILPSNKKKDSLEGEGLQECEIQQ